MPALLGLTFFGILHVPINVPTLAMTTGTSRPNIDKELRNHAAANILSGACGRSLVKLESTKRCRAEALQHTRCSSLTHSLTHSRLRVRVSVHSLCRSLCRCSIPNYLVYSNSVLYFRAGGHSRFAGLLLSAGT